MIISIITLSTFSEVGGIQQYNKSFIKAIEDEYGSENVIIDCLNDNSITSPYSNSNRIRGYSGNKIRFVFNACLHAFKSDIVFIGHINLSVIILILKLLSSKTKSVLLTHGVEMWRPFNIVKRQAIKNVDKVFTVSKYTLESIVRIHNVEPEKIKIIHNTIDPFFSNEVVLNLPLEDEIRIISVARIKTTEKDKGYDKVIEAMPSIVEKYKKVNYYIIGKYDAEEKLRLEKLIKELNLESNVHITGYVTDSQLKEYYSNAHLFILPSKKEGFGIVFIEALLRGMIVIGGNIDGSVDALDNGRLGILTNPSDLNDIKDKIIQGINRSINISREEKEKIALDTIKLFGFNNFKQKIKFEIDQLK